MRRRRGRQPDDTSVKSVAEGYGESPVTLNLLAFGRYVVTLEVEMRKKKYVSNWLSNTSVATIIVGGFQEIDLWLRLLAFAVAVIFFFLGYILNEEN